MHVRDIVPTWPPDGLIVIRTEGNLTELEVDNRDELVRVQLDLDKLLLLIGSLTWASNVIRDRLEVQP